MSATPRSLSHWIAGAFVVLAPALMLSTQGARLSGWTLTVDGLPLSGVEVVLACPPRPVRRTLSDERGRFELVNLPTANCRLWGRKRGYLDGNAEGDPRIPGSYNLRVEGDEWRDGFELRLARGAILIGRVSNAAGQPAVRTRIQAIRRDGKNGIVRLNPLPYMPVGSNGTFELAAIPPGEYYVVASPIPENGDAGGSSGYAITYFPGTATLAEAGLLDLKAGESRQVEFALVHTRAFSISGIAYDFSGGPLANATAALSLDSEPKWMKGSTRTRRDGTFVFTGVQPGSYLVRVGRELIEIGEARVDVVDADVANVIVRAGPRR